MMLLTPPTLAQEPITVTELARNLRLFSGEGEYVGSEQLELTGFLRAAREDAENYTGRKFAPQVVRFTCAAFAPIFRLHPDLTSIVQVQYFDKDNYQQTLDAGIYFCAAESLMFASQAFLPFTYARPDAVWIDAELGGSLVPATVKQAILLIASHWYENREASSPLQIRDVPLSYQWLLDSYRSARIG